MEREGDILEFQERLRSLARQVVNSDGWKALLVLKDVHKDALLRSILYPTNNISFGSGEHMAKIYQTLLSIKGIDEFLSTIETFAIEEG